MRNNVTVLSLCVLFLTGPTQIARSQTTETPHQVTPNSDGTASQPPQNAPPPAANDSDKNPQAKSGSGTNGIPAIVIDNAQAQGILGTQVRSNTGEDMGRIVDVIVDKQAQARGVVIDFGGFLGVGSRQIAVAWNAIRFSPQDKLEFLVVDFTRDQLRAAPAYKSGEQIVLLGPPNNSAVTPANNAAASVTPDKKPAAQ
ncbi:MAG: PRC-barrel domain containing protein [Bradyrhizobiaceae bacterium]|nr:MAG: PRC-barrel domain containing protein [Bradyrhizobiaceae bacterium]